MAARALVLALLLLAATACTTLNIELPSVTTAPTSASLPGKIIWHDLLTNDIEGSKRFYAELFGWEYQEIPLSLGVGKSSKYLLISQRGKLIGGMVDVAGLDTQINSSQWVVLMSVADVDAAADQISNAGGVLLTPPTDLSDRGRIAVAQDNAGAVFAVLETRDGDPLDVQPNYGEFMWDEIWTPDAIAANDFYSAIAPFEPVSLEVSGSNVYQGLASGGRPRMGILQDPIEGLPPTWASYIRVQDMTVLEKVAEAGGTIILPAADRDIGGQVALIAGPSGAGVVLQTWTPEQEQ